MSGRYLHGHHASVLRSHSWRTVENSCPHLIPYLDNPALKILDVGCGPGTITVDLASRVPQGLVLGIDPSADVIQKARKHAEEKGVTNVRFEVGDVFEEKGVDGMDHGAFDIVHAHQVLQHLQNPVGAMEEMKKFAKKGGIVAARDCDYNAMNWYPEHPGMEKWKKLYIAVAESLGAYPKMGKMLHAVAMQAGFPRKDIDASVSVWTYSTPEEREWWCGLWAERSVKSGFKTSALESGLATEADLEEIVQTYRDMEKKEDGWFTVTSGEVICHNRS